MLISFLGVYFVSQFVENEYCMIMLLYHTLISSWLNCGVIVVCRLSFSFHQHMSIVIPQLLCQYIHRLSVLVICNIQSCLPLNYYHFIVVFMFMLVFVFTVCLNCTKQLIKLEVVCFFVAGVLFTYFQFDCNIRSQACCSFFIL